MVIDIYYCTVHFDTSLIDIDLDSRSQKCEKAKQLLTNYPTKFLINLNGIWYTVETCWCDEPHTQFITSFEYSWEGTLLVWFC